MRLVNGTDSVYKDALSGYLTIDVVNYCTNFFPDQADFYDKDAIATIGWGTTYTPNVLIGDVFYIDTAANGGNISGDPAVAIEFDSRLPFTPTTKTFFGKFVASTTPAQCLAETTAPPVGCTSFIATYAPTFQFAGDGREPLGDHYAFRYLADTASGTQSWITVWRSDFYQGNAVNLCGWANPATNKGASGTGLYDAVHQVGILTYDGDENLFGGVGIPRPVRSAARHAVEHVHLPRVAAGQPPDRDRLEPGRLQVRLGRPHAPRRRRHGHHGGHGSLQHGLCRCDAHGPRRVPQRRPFGCQPQRPVPVLAGYLHRGRSSAVNS